MSRKDKKDFSVTDLDFKIDLDIEQDKKAGGVDTLSNKNNFSEPDQASKSNTLDYYRDEMSRKEVEKLYMRTRDKPAQRQEEDEQEFHIELTQCDDEGPLDYEYILNLLKESKREDEEYMKTHGREPYKSEEPYEMHKDSDRPHVHHKSEHPPRQKNTYKIVQIALTAVLAIFFSAFGFMTYRANTLYTELAEVSLHLAQLRGMEERYYSLVAELASQAQDPVHELVEIPIDLAEEIDPIIELEEDVIIGPRIHIVRRGDSLWRISDQVFGDGSLYEEIMRANNIRNPEDIHENMELIIPELP